MNSKRIKNWDKSYKNRENFTDFPNDYVNR